MDLRVFHINEFPKDRIWVDLKEEFRQYLFDQLSFKKLQQENFYRNFGYSSYKQWRSGKCSIPLWFLLYIIRVLKIEVSKFESNITSYQGPSTSTVIKNPKLPLLEDERLVRILTHTLCDGWAGGGFGSKLPKGKSNSGYRNFNLTLLDLFQKDLEVFGDFETTNNQTRGYVIYPNLIRYVLSHLYGIEFGTKDGRIPKNFIDSNRYIAKNIIRAFGDDEGHVYDNHIDFYSINKSLLEDLKRVFGNHFPEIKTGDIKMNIHSKNPKYYFYVLAESRENFHRLIGFLHPTKMKDLEFNIKRVKMPKDRKTKGKILTSLKTKNLTAKELSRELFIEHGTILGHLNRLKREGKVKVINKDKYNSNRWCLNVVS